MYKYPLIVLLAFAFLIGFSATALAQSPAIRIVSPVNRHNVAIGKGTVSVQITGTVPGDGSYWELDVDGLPVQTVRDGRTEGTVEFTQTGPHPIEVILFDKAGNQLASQRILVIAAPVDPLEPVFNRPAMAQVMAVFVVVIIGIIIVGLRVRPRVAS